MKNLEIHFDAKKFGPWYSWIVPHKGLTSIGSGSDPRVISPKKIKENLVSWCKTMCIDTSKARFEAAPINYDYQGYHFGNRFLIGDAAGFPSGLTGEGIFFAMASGEDVANIIINENHEPRLIKNILRIKKEHELILKAFKLNRALERLEYNMLVELLKIKLIEKRAIDLVA